MAPTATYDVIVRPRTQAESAKLHEGGIIATYGLGAAAQLAAMSEAADGTGQGWKDANGQWQCWITKDALGAKAAYVQGGAIMATHRTDPTAAGPACTVSPSGQGSATRPCAGTRRNVQTLSNARTRVFVIGYPLGYQDDSYDKGHFTDDRNLGVYSYTGGDYNIAYIVGARRYFYLNYAKPEVKRVFLVRAAKFGGIVEALEKNRAMKTIGELVIISHGSNVNSGGINLGKEAFTPTVFSTYQQRMIRLQSRFARNAKIYVLACWAGQSQPMLQDIGTFLGKRGGKVYASTKSVMTSPQPPAMVNQTPAPSVRPGFTTNGNQQGPWYDHDGNDYPGGTNAFFDQSVTIAASR